MKKEAIVIVYQKNVDGEMDVDVPVTVFFDETLADNYIDVKNKLIDNVMKKRDELIDKSFGDYVKIRSGMDSWSEEEKAFFKTEKNESFVLPCQFLKVKVPVM